MHLFTGTYRALATHLADRIADERSSTFDAWLERPVEILVPSRSVAAGIAAALLERLPGGVAGIVMETPDELARRILAASGTHRRVASDDERRLAMRAAVASIDEPAFERRGAAAMVERTYRDVRDSALTIDEFEKRSRRAGGSNATRLPNLCAAFRAYEKHLRAIDAIDPADLLHGAAAAIAVAPQVVFGFYDVTGIQETFIRSLAARGAVSAFYVPVEIENDGALSPATRFGSRFLETARQLSGSTPRVVAPAGTAALLARSGFAPEVEILDICRAVRDALDAGMAPGELAVVTRAFDPAEQRELARCARFLRFRISREPGNRLASTRLARGVILLLRLQRDRFRRSDVIELLHCGIRSSEVGLKDSPEFLDRATRIGQIPGGNADAVRLALPRIEMERSSLVAPVSAYATVVEALERITSGLDSPRSADGWASTLERLAGMFSIRSEGDLAAFQAITAIAATLRRTAAFGGMLDAETIAAMIVEAPDLDTSSDESLPKVWAGDVMRLRGRSFRRIWAMRLQHDRFPQRRVDDPLLPDFVRAAIGVKEIGDGRDEERMLFNVLTTAATETLTCSFSLTDGLGTSLRPSQLLKDALIVRHPESRSEIVGGFETWLRANAGSEPRATTPQESAAAEIRDGSAVLGAALHRRLLAISRFGTHSAWDGYLTVDPPLAEKLEEKLARLSPSYLEWFGECPHRFLYSRILGIDDLTEPEEQVQIEIRNKGSLDHTILQRFYERVFAARPQTVPEWSPELAAELTKAIEECFDEFDATHPPSNPPLRSMERALTHVKLAAFVISDFESLRESSLVPRYFEHEFGDPTHPTGRMPVRIGPIDLPMRGFVDRIDVRTDGGKHRVVDYKSGKAGKQRGLDEKIDAGHALQLAFYAIAIAQAFALRDEEVSGRILPLDAPESTDKQFAFELAEKRPVLEAILPLFLDAMRKGVYPAFTKLKDAKWCDYCALRPHCRTYHSMDEKRVLSDFENVREMLEAVQHA